MKAVDDGGGDQVRKHHEFFPETYRKPTKCHMCKKLFLGMSKQGVKCHHCEVNVHRKCIERANAELECGKVVAPAPIIPQHLQQDFKSFLDKSSAKLRQHGIQVGGAKGGGNTKSSQGLTDQHDHDLHHADDAGSLADHDHEEEQDDDDDDMNNNDQQQEEVSSVFSQAELQQQKLIEQQMEQQLEKAKQLERQQKDRQKQMLEEQMKHLQQENRVVDNGDDEDGQAFEESFEKSSVDLPPQIPMTSPKSRYNHPPPPPPPPTSPPPEMEAEVEETLEQFDQDDDDDHPAPIVVEEDEEEGGRNDDSKNEPEENAREVEDKEKPSLLFGDVSNRTMLEDEEGETGDSDSQFESRIPSEEGDDQGSDGMVTDDEEFFFDEEEVEDQQFEEETDREDFGTLFIQILETMQVEMEGKTRLLRSNLRASACNVRFGEKVFALGRKNGKDDSFKQQEEDDMGLNALSPNRPNNAAANSLAWNYGATHEFPVKDVSEDLYLRVQRKEQTMGLIVKKKSGRVIIPFYTIIKETSDAPDGIWETWFELFPEASKRANDYKFRAAAPIVGKSGLDFPSTSLGYIRLRIRLKLNSPYSNVWKLYYEPIRSSSNSSKRKASSIKDTLETFKEVRRNSLRISLARKYWHKHVSSAPAHLLEHIRSWEDPSHSLLYLVCMGYVVLIAPMWQIPLLLYGGFVQFHFFALRKKKLTMNWESVPVPKVPRRKSKMKNNKNGIKEPKSNNSSMSSNAEGSGKVVVAPSNGNNAKSSASASSSRRPSTSSTDGGQTSSISSSMSLAKSKMETMLNKINKKVERQIAIPDDDEVEFPAIQKESLLYERPEDKVFLRLEFGEDFLIWNKLLRDSNKGLNIFQKSARASNELRWIQNMSAYVANISEKIINLLNASDEHVSYAVNVVACVAVVSISMGLFLYSIAPNLCRMFVYCFGVVLNVLPKPIYESLPESVRSKKSSNPIHSYLSTLWERIPNSEELGHRFVSSQQQVYLMKPAYLTDEDVTEGVIPLPNTITDDGLPASPQRKPRKPSYHEGQQQPKTSPFSQIKQRWFQKKK